MASLYCLTCLDRYASTPVAQSFAVARIGNPSPSPLAGDGTDSARALDSKNKPAGGDSSRRPMSDAFGELVGGKVWPS